MLLINSTWAFLLTTPGVLVLAALFVLVYGAAIAVTIRDSRRYRALLAAQKATRNIPRPRPTTEGPSVTLTCARDCGAHFTVGHVTTTYAAREHAARFGWTHVFDETDLSVADLCPDHRPDTPTGA